MKILIHLVGPQCCGKTYVLDEFRKNSNVAIWDILDWYNNSGCLVDGVMDWTVWKEKKDEIWIDFQDFLANTKEIPIVILETSGMNQDVNTNVQQYKDQLITIFMVAPTKEELKERIKLRNLDLDTTIKIHNVYKEREISAPEKELTIEETGLFIKALIEKYQENQDEVAMDNKENCNSD